MVPRSTGKSGSRSRLPRTRGDGPYGIGVTGCWNRSAPHTRGWSLYCLCVVLAIEVCPAHAGMVPKFALAISPTIGLPRTRGDGPFNEDLMDVIYASAPHTRGWSPIGLDIRDIHRVCPAHAGMVPIKELEGLT